MKYVIQTSPNRATRKYTTPVVKYAIVQSNGKFKFVTDIHQATLFGSAGLAIQAIGFRAKRVNKITADLTLAQVDEVIPTPAPTRQVRQVLNGRTW